MEDDVGKMGFHYVDNDLGDVFILSVAKANKSKILKVDGISTFRNQAGVGNINLLLHNASIKGVFKKLGYRGPYDISEFLVEGVNSIRPRGIGLFKRKDNFSDLILFKNSLSARMIRGADGPSS